MSQAPLSSPAAPFRVIVLSVVKHDYIARAVADHPRFELVAVADDDNQPKWVHERNLLFAQQHGIPYLRDVERALSTYRGDVAVVSSEAARHASLTIRAARAGMHVIQDKPMSTTVAECDEIVTAIETERVRFLMWNRNGLPAVSHAQQVVSSGRLGKLIAAHVDFFFAKDAGPPLGSRGPTDPPIDWLTALREAHATGADGGVGKHPMGELPNEGCYPLAYLWALTKQPVTQVFAQTANQFHQLHADNHVEDLAAMTLLHSSGLRSTVCCGRIGQASHPDLGENKIRLVGTEGSLVVSEPRPEVSIFYRDQLAAEFRNRPYEFSENDFSLVDQFARCIDRQSDSLLPVEVSRHITATTFAALESARKKCLVAVN